ncbi:MAG: hypothetical protein VXZ96_20515 [Myxococcota bacterium]|mgnify:CR=1 FL=1|nr:hypothetical protein [Myxococcota bacterium]MEC8382723.1 hypothetical protein [Myxococcota bacterium]
MTNVQVFLKTALFSFADVPNVADPVPSSVLMVEGQIVENRSGGVVIDVKRYFDGRRRERNGQTQRLFIPMGKIDHIREPSQ